MPNAIEPTETPTEEFIRDFGAAWTYDLGLDDEPVVIFQAFECDNRSILETGRIFKAPHGDWRSFATEREARDEAVFEKRKKLQLELDRLKTHHRTFANWLQRLQLPWLGDAQKRQREVYEDALRKLRTGESVHTLPLPATLEHYGRLDLDTNVWLVDPDPAAGFPISAATVCWEGAPVIWNLPAAVPHHRAADFHRPPPYSLGYYLATESGKRIEIDLGEAGIKVRNGPGVQVHLDHDQALTARQALIEQIATTIQDQTEALRASPGPTV